MKIELKFELGFPALEEHTPPFLSGETESIALGVDGGSGVASRGRFFDLVGLLQVVAISQSAQVDFILTEIQCQSTGRPLYLSTDYH